MIDEQICLHGSVLQHGKSNDRIYLMKYTSENREALFHEMSRLAESQDYGKIFIKIPQGEEDFFRVRGFGREGVIPGYFHNDDALLMGAYLKKERLEIPQEEQNRIKQVLESAVYVDKTSEPESLGDPYQIRKLEPVHINLMADIYRKVFPSYPFPIDDPGYLLQTMDSHVSYFGCFYKDTLIGLSSAEMDRKTATVEMTDFAVLPEYRGRQIAFHLLVDMEHYVRQEGIRCAYTIARAVSFGMNKTFAKAAYTFGGTLWNNTQISGSIESMNIWHKRLRKAR